MELDIYYYRNDDNEDDRIDDGLQALLTDCKLLKRSTFRCEDLELIIEDFLPLIGSHY